jgi:hypothetical protein
MLYSNAAKGPDIMSWAPAHRYCVKRLNSTPDNVPSLPEIHNITTGYQARNLHSGYFPLPRPSEQGTLLARLFKAIADI